MSGRMVGVFAGLLPAEPAHRFGGVEDVLRAKDFPLLAVDEEQATQAVDLVLFPLK